ncbi:MAG: hypothetical protein EB037_06915, partial [Actinobacteria bacterium]|nr:hypothetical protein [Actinomycetota bacterium]
VSSFTGVRIDPLGGIFLTGYFYGQFENLTSNGQWVRFVQHRNTTGSVDWTVQVDTVAGSTPPRNFEWQGVDGDGTLFLRRAGVPENFFSISRLGTINTSSSGICVGSSSSDSNLVADETSGLLCLKSVPVAQGASWRVQKLDASFNTVWERTVTDQGDQIQTITPGPAGSLWAIYNLNPGNLGSNTPLPQDFRAALGMKRFSSIDGSQIVAIKHFGINLAGASAVAWKNTIWLRANDGTTQKNTVFSTNDGQIVGNFPHQFGLLGPRFTTLNAAIADQTIVDESYVAFDKYFPPLKAANVPNCFLQSLALSGQLAFNSSRVNGSFCGSSTGLFTNFTNDGRRLIIGFGRRLWVIEFDGADVPQPVRNVLSKEFESTIEDIDADDLGNIYVVGSTFTTNLSTASTDRIGIQSTFTNQRAFITRNPGGRLGLTVLPRTPLRFKVTGTNNVPDSGVGAVSLNVTVTSPRGEGFVTVFPCDSLPEASNLNYVLNETVPNAVIAPVSADGEVCFYTYAETHLIADVNGYFPTGSGFVSNTPARVIDTRVGAAQGLRTVSKTKVGNGTELRVQFTNLPGGITPATGVGAVSLNVTVTGSRAPDAGGFVTVYPCGNRPNASNLNFTSGQTVPNAVITPLSANGEVCFYVYGETDLIADINGYFPAGSGFVATDPVRIADTRAGSEQGLRTVTKQRIGGNTTLQLQLTNLPGGITPASGIGAVSLNVTAVNTTANQFGGYVTTYPCGSLPDVSSLNFVSNQIVPNAVIAPLSANGTICFFAYGQTDLIVDLNGYFPTGAGFVPVNPKRIFDTR